MKRLTSLFGAGLAVGLVAFLGCNKETKAAAETPSAPAEGTTTESPSELSKSSFKEDGFQLSLKPKGDYKVGVEGTAQIVLEAKGPFKCNDKYPYKFKTAASPGVKYSSETFTKDSLELSKKKAVMTVKFTPESAGKKKVAGTFKFSVCTADKCMIEKRDLSLAVNVK